MKAYFSDTLMVETTREELLLCRQGAKDQMIFAFSQAKRCKNATDTRKIWTSAGRKYMKLVKDIDKIIDSMPF